MGKISVQFLGAGDAFGSGARFNTCILIKNASGSLLLDCGISSQIALRKFRVNPNDIQMIILSHLHGDHFGGIPFFLLDAQFVGNRTAPLTIAGPEGVQSRVLETAELLFPETLSSITGFAYPFTELHAGEIAHIHGIKVQSFEVYHPSGAPALALRVEIDGKVIAFSGDTGWTETLYDVAQGADLFICECFSYQQKLHNHLDLETLLAHKEEFQSQRIILTHLGPEMLKQRDSLPWETAEDGYLIELE